MELTPNNLCTCVAIAVYMSSIHVAKTLPKPRVPWI